MPQEHQVVRCFSCETFQVHIVKKIPKWQCKLCDTKQSLKKVYARGNGKECREHVQNLNIKRQTMPSVPQTEIIASDSAQINSSYLPADGLQSLKTSKWDQFLNNEGDNEDRIDAIDCRANLDNLPSEFSYDTISVRKSNYDPSRLDEKSIFNFNEVPSSKWAKYTNVTELNKRREHTSVNVDAVQEEASDHLMERNQPDNLALSHQIEKPSCFFRTANSISYEKKIQNDRKNDLNCLYSSSMSKKFKFCTATDDDLDSLLDF